MTYFITNKVFIYMGFGRNINMIVKNYKIIPFLNSYAHSIQKKLE